MIAMTIHRLALMSFGHLSLKTRLLSLQMMVTQVHSGGYLNLVQSLTVPLVKVDTHRRGRHQAHKTQLLLAVSTPDYQHQLLYQRDPLVFRQKLLADQSLLLEVQQW
jgi:hypothetical protein